MSKGERYAVIGAGVLLAGVGIYNLTKGVGEQGGQAIGEGTGEGINFLLTTLGIGVAYVASEAGPALAALLAL